jgi:hypothetical protein
MALAGVVAAVTVATVPEYKAPPFPAVTNLVPVAPYASPRKSAVPAVTPFAGSQSWPAILGVASTDGEPAPPGPPLVRLLTEKEYCMPLYKPQTEIGASALIVVVQSDILEQFAGVTPAPAALNNQYVTPDDMSQVSVTRVSLARAVTLVGAGAELPPLPMQPSKNKAATAARENPKYRFIRNNSLLKAESIDPRSNSMAHFSSSTLGLPNSLQTLTGRCGPGKRRD